MCGKRPFDLGGWESAARLGGRGLMLEDSRK